jgi:hypothetical protein
MPVVSQVQVASVPSAAVAQAPVMAVPSSPLLLVS